ncbi:hypothetical protein Syun_017550 [Stephania yunnanensis]|uniref:Uncharacterized protein n=1 Tax=Stephania yunnanensis TaxID=152371 RepID=A0AAP0P359_9MAGN
MQDTSRAIPRRFPWHEQGCALARARSRHGRDKVASWHGQGIPWQGLTNLNMGVDPVKGGMGKEARETLEHALGNHAKARRMDGPCNSLRPLAPLPESLSETHKSLHRLPSLRVVAASARGGAVCLAAPKPSPTVGAVEYAIAAYIALIPRCLFNRRHWSRLFVSELETLVAV